MNNNPQDDWIGKIKKPKTDPNKKYEKYYYKWKQRIHRGENPDSASADAPPGFREWLKSYKRIK